MNRTFISFRAISVAAFVSAMSSVAFAQSDYPSRPIKIVVPLPPGGVADIVPRLIAERLAARWAQPVIIENRPGAALNIGAEAVARAVPDGYTLLATPPGPLVVSQHFFPKLAFDPRTFVPVSIMVQVPTVLVANPKVPVSTFAELIAYAKSNPNRLSYGSPGTGNTPQLAMEKLMATAGIQFLHVPYQGLTPALRDLLAGHVDVMIDNLGNVLEHIKDDRLKLIAATTEARLSQFPNVPTIAETFPGFTHMDWFALVAPAKTSPEIVAKLSQAIAEVLRLPDIARRMSELNVTPIGSTPAEAAALIEQESKRWQQVIAAAGLKAE
jgi:tripartite-type tricarboxylate transporter receptor subunit TctC